MLAVITFTILAIALFTYLRNFYLAVLSVRNKQFSIKIALRIVGVFFVPLGAVMGLM